MIGQDPEMLQMFLEESQEHLSGLEPDLLELEKTKDNPEQELINRIFRAVHSLKGSAGFFGFDTITKISHAMENLLSMVRDGKLKPTSEMITTLLDGTDKLVMMINDVDNSDTIDIEEDLKKINILMTGKPIAGETVQVKPKDEDSLSEKLVKQFQIDMMDLKKVISHGHFLYAVKAYTHKDMKDRGRTPMDYIKNIQKLGSLIASYSDISNINGLENFNTKDIAFVFLFSSVLEPDLIALGLEVPEDQVTLLELSEIKDIPKKEEVKAENIKPVEKEETKPINESISKPTKEKKKVVHTENLTKETLRVHVSLLNDLMTLAGEMVLARNQLLRMTESFAKDIPGLPSVLQDINMTTTLLQGKIMDTRMQPISAIFNKFPRVIRDMSKMLNKKIHLDITGNEVDLDKSIIENLSDPLTHLIRNSGDHGIEMPEERKKLGKNETGTIWLKAYHEGGKVNIDVIDDGRGLDPKKLVAKAIQKGLITEQDVKHMSKKDIHALIFKPGFSTADKVSDISGRGVGMDVVRTNIEKLGGSVSIDSELGQGTTINLKLPLTLAIIPSLIINVQDMHFAVPQIALKELVRLRQGDDGKQIEYVNNSPVLRLRNKLLPIVYLEEVLKLPKVEKKDKSTRILVLQQDENEFGLVVDEIFDSEEIVVKSIPRFFSESRCYSGSTIMGDGSVALILDITGIAIQSNLKFIDEKLNSNSADDTDKEDESSNELQNLLLFENAPNELFALNLDLIKRIEKLPITEIDKVGEKEYIIHEGKSLMVVRLEHFLPVRTAPDSDDDIYVIIPKLVENPIGIIAHKIIDAVEVDAKIDTENITAKGMIGSALINKEIVLFPDIYEIVEMADPEKSHKFKSSENNKFKILLIEDTPFFRTLEKQYISSAGYTVDTAVDGFAGLKKASQNKYDLFIVDIIMPRMDGMEFVKSIKRDPRLNNIPTMALTTLTNEETKQQAFDAGFDEYEVKVHKEKLLRKIKDLLQVD
jgi:two-component system chemotaxis sensor kinase CheA